MESKPTVAQRRLGLELRKLRRMRGWTLEEAAERLEYSVSSLSKIENGRQRISARVLPFLFQVFEVADESSREELTRLVRDLAKRQWWQEHKDVVSGPLADYLSLEAQACEVAVFNPLVVPGLLQTEEYARAVAEGSRAWESPQQVERFVRVRLVRQRLLTRNPPLRVRAVLTEGVLRQRVGGPGVLREQLVRLVELVRELPRVEVRILPFDAGAHPGMDGPFTLLGFASGDDVVCLEAMRASLCLEQPAEVAPYAAALRRLRSAALSTRQSLSLMEELIEELGR